MTAIALPREVATECAVELSLIVAKLHRDAATLTRTASALLTGSQHGRPLGILKKYARENEQYGADEVEEVIATIEAAVDPDHIKHLARLQARRDKERAAFEKGCSEPRPTYWELTAAREKAAKPRQNGNVIDGPWAS